MNESNHPIMPEGPGPAAPEEILEEWQVVDQLARRLNDPLWRLEPQFAPEEPFEEEDDLLAGLEEDDFDAVEEADLALEEKAAEAEDAAAAPARRRRILPRIGELAGTFYEKSLGPLLRTAYRRASGVAYHSGAEVVAAVAVDTARRLRSLMAVEGALPSGADYGVVVAPACVCLELAIGEVLRPVNRAHAKLLAEELDHAGWPRQAELLRKWSTGGLPMTMGLQVTILAALEKKSQAWLGEPRGIWGDLGMTFKYADLIRSGKLSAILERVRTQYRNPACHGTRTFEQSEYTPLAQMLLARDCFRVWYRRGPAELNTGLLDLHLLEWREQHSALR